MARLMATYACPTCGAESDHDITDDYLAARACPVCGFQMPGEAITELFEGDAPPADLLAGEFLDARGRAVRVEIEGGGIGPGGLEFPHDSPVTVEWDADAKHEPVQGSSATVKVVSDTDRRFLPLWTTASASVRLRVLVDGDLYWAGTLDTETYEEPYSTAAGYEVSLSFSDLAPLSRVAVDASSASLRLGDLVAAAARMAGLPADAVVEAATTLRDASGAAVALLDAAVPAAAFVDDAEGPKSLRDALEAMLLPMGLTLRQWRGRLRLFSLHAAATAMEADTLEWVADDQVLGVDKVYNSVAVNYDPQDRGTPIEADEYEYDGTKADGYYKSYLASASAKDIEFANVGFRLVDNLGGAAHPQEVVAIPAPASLASFTTRTAAGRGFAAVVPEVNGEAMRAMFFRVPTWGLYGAAELDSARRRLGEDSLVGLPEDAVAYMTAPVRIPLLDASRHLLLLDVPMLFDDHLNPWGGASDNWGSGVKSDFGHADYVFLALDAALEPDDGGQTLHYCNNAYAFALSDKSVWGGGVVTPRGRPRPAARHDYWSPSSYRWGFRPPTEGGCAVLQYCDMKDDQGARDVNLSGWRSPVPPKGTGSAWYAPQVLSAPSGMLMAPPPKAGRLTIRVGARPLLAAWVDASVADMRRRTGSILPAAGAVRWFALRAPSLKIVSAGGTHAEAGGSDTVTWRGVLDPRAADELELDTLCGSFEGVNPLGAFNFKTLERAGRRGAPEQMLIGTLHSQHATRHAVLSGTARPPLSPVVRDASLAGSPPMLVTRMTHDVRADEAEVTAVEVSADSFDAKAG